VTEAPVWQDIAATLRPLLDSPNGSLAPPLLTLTLVTGLVDATSYLKLGHVFVANMTGNVVFLGFGLAGPRGHLHLGIADRARLVSRRRRRGRSDRARSSTDRGRHPTATTATELLLVAACARGRQPSPPITPTGWVLDGAARAACTPAPAKLRGKREGLYLPREVFFGRLVFAGAFVPVCASDFGRFFPATSGSFRLMCSR
jgi:hypothetical protein